MTSYNDKVASEYYYISPLETDQSFISARLPPGSLPDCSVEGSGSPDSGVSGS